MKVRTNSTTQIIHIQANQPLVQTPRPATGLRVKTHVKAGALLMAGLDGLDGIANPIRYCKPYPFMKVKRKVKARDEYTQHNETLGRVQKVKTKVRAGLVTVPEP